MCENCPFKPGSPTSRHKDNWLKILELKGPQEHPQGCHVIAQPDDRLFEPDPDLQCVGHREYKEKQSGCS
jgi:hypothetical protein